MQNHIIIAEKGRSTVVYTSKETKQVFGEQAVVRRSDNYWQDAFRYAVHETNAAVAPFIIALATGKQPLSAANIRLNCDPDQLLISFNPDWKYTNCDYAVDLAASAAMAAELPEYDDAISREKNVIRMKEAGISGERLQNPELRLQAILKGYRKIWQS